MAQPYNCGKCHTCGTELEPQRTKRYDWQSWCPTCRQAKHYESHGWPRRPRRKGYEAIRADDATPCPEVAT